MERHPKSILLLIFLAATGDRRRLRGGKQAKRDRWFGLSGRQDFDEFRSWWHREGKERAGGDDLRSRAEAELAYDEWVSLDRPKPR